MAVETTTITGKVLLPGGAAPPVGSRLVIRLSQSGRAEDGGATQVVGGTIEGRITSDGSVKAADGTSALMLVPNDAITPAGTYYRVEFSVPGGLGWTELWNVTTSPDPVEVGDIQRLSEATPGVIAPTGYATSSLPTASANYSGQIWLKLGGGGVRDILAVCLKGTDGNYDWLTLAEGEG